MDELGHVFGALSDATRRQVLQTLMADGTTSVPSLTERLPMTRQAIAKHLAVLADAGLVEREDPQGREVRYRLRDGGLREAVAWLEEADRLWDERLARLKTAVEGDRRPGGRRDDLTLRREPRPAR